MSYTWFRMYSDIIDDPKVESLTHAQRWIWVTVLCLASRSPVRGYLLLSKERSGERSFDVPGNGSGTESQHLPVPIRIIAKKAEATLAEAEEALLLFESLEMMDRDSDGLWHVSHWEQRQFKSDDVTARTRKYKEKAIGEERSLERSQDVPGNGDGTPQTTDNRLNSPHSPPRGKRPRGRQATRSPEYTPDYERFWTEYPPLRRERKIEAFECWLARLAEGVSAEDLITAAANYAVEVQGKEKSRIKQPTTFLGPNERWQEHTEAPGPAPLSRPGERPFHPINEFS